MDYVFENPPTPGLSAHPVLVVRRDEGFPLNKEKVKVNFKLPERVWRWMYLLMRTLIPERLEGKEGGETGRRRICMLILIFFYQGVNLY